MLMLVLAAITAVVDTVAVVGSNVTSVEPNGDTDQIKPPLMLTDPFKVTNPKVISYGTVLSNTMHGLSLEPNVMRHDSVL